MPFKRPSRPQSTAPTNDGGALDQVVARALAGRAERERGYREQSLKIHPWICGRCGREFSRENLHELTVHHKDHNHDNNPPDGSNWENLCIYCHENEHARYVDHVSGGGVSLGSQQTDAHGHKAFAGLKGLLQDKRK